MLGLIHKFTLQSSEYIIIKPSHHCSHDPVEPLLKVSSLRSNYLPVLAVSPMDVVISLPKLPTHVLTPHSLACLPTGAAAPTATVASAGGGVSRAVFFNLFALLLILRGSPGKCHRVQGGRHKDPIGHKKNKSGQRKKAHEIQALNYLVNF